MKNAFNEIGILLVILLVINSCKKDEIPSLTTSAITNLTGISATSGGTITGEGTGTVLSRGVCWSTVATPTIADNKTIDGAGAGNFTSNLTGLNGASVYYVRAYATNSIGTGYGMVMSFTTLGQVPTPTTTVATNITTSSATLNGSVNPNYLSTVVTFEYGTTASYGNTVTSTQSPMIGNASMNVNADIISLTAGTVYHYRIKTVNSLGTTYSNDITFTSLPNGVTDADGNVYNVVIIGTQIWMAQNLKTTKYNDGTSIPNVTVDASWYSLTTGAYCDYALYPVLSTTYGKLYNWYIQVSSNSQNICPTGWHVPNDEDWTILTTYLGGLSVAGGKLKVIGTADWFSPNTGATNETGFSAFPCGYRDYYGTFHYIGNDSYWWSSSERDATTAWNRTVSYNNSNVTRGYNFKTAGYSIRCLKN